MEKTSKRYLSTDQLRIGIYVLLDIPWVKHPFSRSKFKIKDEHQIHILKNMGLSQVQYDPDRSDCLPDSVNLDKVTESSQQKSISAGPVESTSHKKANEALNHQLFYMRSSSLVDEALNKVKTDPKVSKLEADSLVSEMISNSQLEGISVVHLMNWGNNQADSYSHPLNVTVLSLMMAKALNLSTEEMHSLCLASIFHDMGKIYEPDNTGKFSSNDISVRRRHVLFGDELVEKLNFSERVLKIIRQHHENYDGSGYPLGLKGVDIDPLARILSLINAYDNICNPLDGSTGMTPYGALSFMFTTERKKHDRVLLNILIKQLGIYPPGSIIKLNDGTYGLVVSVNPTNLLRPVILSEYLSVTDQKPILIDLSEMSDMAIQEGVSYEHAPESLLSLMPENKKKCYFFRNDKTLLANVAAIM